MKSQLAFDRNSSQFRCDLGKPSKRFYLGSDAKTAQQRKTALVAFWKDSGASEWDRYLVAEAKKIAKGEQLQIVRQPNETLRSVSILSTLSDMHGSPDCPMSARPKSARAIRK